MRIPRFGVAAFAAVALSAFAVAPSDGASPCTTSWAAAATGNWNDVVNWTGGVPTSGSVACITVAGTYTVRAFGGNETAKSLVLGGDSGVQTLQVGGADFAYHGRIELTGQEADHGIRTNGRLLLGESHVIQPDNQQVGTHGTLVLAGTLTNDGVIESGVNLNSPNVITGGDIDNRGTIAVPWDLNVGGTSHWTTSGTLSVAATRSLVIAWPAASSLTQTAGTISVAGRILQTGGAFIANGPGAATGNPIELEHVAITPTGTGSGSFELRGGDDVLAGDVGAGYTLRVAGRVNAHHGVLSIPSPRVNLGTLLLGSTDGTHGQLAIPALSKLTNQGTLRSSKTDNGANRLDGDLDNQATMTVDEDLDSNGPAAWKTTGSLAIAGGKTLRLNWNVASSFRHAAGTIANAGRFLQSFGSFEADGAGTATGAPLELEHVTVRATGTGAGSFEARGGDDILGADLAAGYTLRVAGRANAYHGRVFVDANRTNLGTILLGSGDGTQGRITVSGTSVLTNQGTLRSTGIANGSNHVDGDLANPGTLDLDESLDSGGAGVDWTTSGTVDVAAGKLLELAWDDAGTFTQTGGGIANHGRILQRNGTFSATGAGTITDKPYEVNQGTTLFLTGTGSGTVHSHGSDVLGADVAAGYTILVGGNPGGNHGRLELPASRTNHGTLVLGVGDSTHGDVIMAAGATLTNAGTIRAARTGPGGVSNGPDTISGPLVNTGTVRVEETLNTTGAVTSSGTVEVTGTETFAPQAFTQTGGVTTLAAGATLAAVTGPVVLQAGATLAGSGTVGPGLTSAGDVSPGASPGTLHVSGSYLQQAAGTLTVDVEGVADGQHDLLAVTGDATLAGTLRLRPSTAVAAAAAPKDQFTFLTFGGSRTGTFAAVEVEPALAQGKPVTVAYDDTGKLARAVVGDPPPPKADPEPTVTATPAPAATATPAPAPTATPAPRPPVADFKLSGVKLAKRAFRARKGTTLRMTVSLSAQVVVEARRGGKRRGKFSFRAAKGANALRFRPKKLRPGRYTAVVTVTDSLGRARKATLAFRVVRP